MKPTKLLLIASFLLVGVLGSGAAMAGPATDVVRTKQTALFALIAQASSASREAKLKELFDEMLDYGLLARSSLGDKWGTLTAAQQTEFSGLLEQLVRHNYQRNLKDMLGWEIQYVGEKQAGAGIIVKTRAVSKTNARAEPIELDFRMTQSDGIWLVGDLIPEGASLVDTYQRQFTRILTKDGYPALKEKMLNKLAKLREVAR